MAIDGHLVVHTSHPGSGELFVFHEYGRWSLLTVTTARSADNTARVSLHRLGSLDELDGVLEQEWGRRAAQDLLAGIDGRLLLLEYGDPVGRLS